MTCLVVLIRFSFPYKSAARFDDDQFLGWRILKPFSFLDNS